METRQTVRDVTALDLGPLGSFPDYLSWRLETRQFATKGERTRHRLKVAAARILESTGYQQMRVTDVCDEAKVGLGTFYVYFTDKTAISVEVLLEFAEEVYSQALRTAVGHDAFDALYLSNRFFVHAYQQNSGLLRSILQLDDTVPEFQERWRYLRQEWNKRIIASIIKRTGHPELDQDKLVQISFALAGMVFHFLYDLFVREEPDLKRVVHDLDESAELLSLLWYRAVYGTTPPTTSLGLLAQSLSLKEGE
jgi:AcrR family transcriptional regulator